MSCDCEAWSHVLALDIWSSYRDPIPDCFTAWYEEMQERYIDCEECQRDD